MAAIIKGTIEVNVDVAYVNAPKFAGVYRGDFSYDDTHLTKVGEEFMTINGGDCQTRPGLLSFNFRFLSCADGLIPITYTARDEFTFPDTPVLGFENGIPTQFYFQFAPGDDGGVWGEKNGFMFGDPGVFFFFLHNGAIRGSGSVTLKINKSPPTVAPENASPLASFLAFLGLAGVHLPRKSRKDNN